MTVMEVSGNPTTHERDQVRQTLNTMIRDYVNNSNEQDRICLVDLAKGIPYHSMTDQEERKQIWDDGIHLKPAGYDRIATLVFLYHKNQTLTSVVYTHTILSDNCIRK
jgi:lysophospholipase L1-like esterase